MRPQKEKKEDVKRVGYIQHETPLRSDVRSNGRNVSFEKKINYQMEIVLSLISVLFFSKLKRNSFLQQEQQQQQSKPKRETDEIT